jgi:hypothetical protein
LVSLSVRFQLYTAAELFADFKADDPDSYARCADISILRYFVAAGRNPTQDSRASTLEALHDNSISAATQELLGKSPKVVALMGGHGMERGTSSYENIAYLGRDLGAAGFLVATGEDRVQWRRSNSEMRSPTTLGRS